MKSKLIKAVASSLLAVVACASLAFVFGIDVVKTGSQTQTNGFSLAEWFGMTNESVLQAQIWKISRIFLFVALSMVVIAAAVSVLRIFVDNKCTKTIAKVFGLAGLVMTILFLVTFVSGGFLYANYANSSDVKHLYFLHAGAALTVICAVAASCFATPWKTFNKNKGEKNENIA